MVKQRGLGESNQKSEAAGTAQQAEQSASLSVSVTWLTASWPGGYSNGSAAVSTDRSCGDLIERNCHVVLNRPVAMNSQVVTNHHVILKRPLQRPHPSASSLKAQMVIAVPRRLSSVSGLSLGLQLAIIVQFELTAMSFVDLAVVYQ